MVEVFTLEVHLRAAEMLGPATGMVDRTRTTDVMFELVFELGDEIGIAAIPCVAFAQLIERVDQRLGDEHAPVRTEMTALVGKVVAQVIHHLHPEPPG